MGQAHADRNLLFGILALQNNFVDRHALVDAFNRWVEDKAKPLGQILVERGALSADQCVLLHGLAAAHIAKFGNDPERSLAALSSVGSIRREIEQIADTELQVSIAVLGTASTEHDPFATRTPSVGESTSDGLRFRILRPHAKGGLGQVSVALDQELDRRVALKEIQDKYADDRQSRARFVQEAEITGKLEHPGIIPVYGLGHDATGRPFYAMRFIEGDSLRDAIRRFHADESLKQDAGKKSLRLRELLRRFQDVCNAMAYAHSRGVLHRDLKPGNIMLGPFGETLVVDWGLAKSTGEESASDPEASTVVGDGPVKLSTQSGSREETLPGSAVGTPGYMSPEQAAGRLDLLSPASDVYGLGAILYSLLSGSSPIKSDGLELGEILRRVQTGEIPPPRSIDASIPRPLEAICLKAMAVRIEDRYPSAKALAEDVTKWLGDQPVAAYREPFSVRSARWMRRHRTLVTASAAVLVTGLLVGLLGVTVWLIRPDVRLIRESERREKLAIDAVRKFRDAVQNNSELKNRPELELARKAILRETLEFFRNLRDQLQTDLDSWPDSNRDTWRGPLERLAGANYDLAYTTAEIGSVTNAIECYIEAIEIREKLARENPTVAAYRSDLVISHSSLGKLLITTGRLDEAIDSFRRAVEIQERLASDRPDIDTYRHDLATSLYRISCSLSLTLPSKSGKERGDVAARVVEILKQAIAAGWRNAVHTSRDPNLIPLRDREDFRKLLAEMFDKGFPDNPFAP